MAKDKFQMDGVVIANNVLDFLDDKFPDFDDAEHKEFLKGIIFLMKKFFPGHKRLQMWLVDTTRLADPVAEAESAARLRDPHKRQILLRIVYATAADYDDSAMGKFDTAFKLKYPLYVTDYFLANCEW